MRNEGSADGPTARPPGPQYASAQVDVVNGFERLSGVSRAWLTQSARRVLGPPVVVLEPTADWSLEDFADMVAGEAESVAPAGGAIEVHPGPDGCRFNPESIPPGATIGATARVWRHPFAEEAMAALHRHEAVADFDLGWAPTFDHLSIQPGTVHWDEVADLGIATELVTDHADGAPESITRTLRAEIVADRPEAYIAGVTRHSDWNDGAEGTGALYTLGFASRTDYADARSRVYEADGEQLSSVVGQTGGPDDVQLTITSPPYLGAIDYDAHATMGDERDWAGQSHDGEVAAWMEMQREIFQSVFDATAEGGYCAVVIGTVKLDNQSWAPLPHHFAEVMQDTGWTFHERIVWNKVTGGSPRFGTTVQNPYPTYYYPNQQHEEIQVWRKGDIVNRRDEASKLAMTDLMKQEIANNVWHVAPVPMNADIDHPCPFPEEIAHRLTLLYSCDGDIVADPMAGSGTTLKVADRLGRIAVGTELRPEYVAEARHRLSTEEYERRDQLLPSFDSVDAPVETVQQDRNSRQGTQTTLPKSHGTSD